LFKYCLSIVLEISFNASPFDVLIGYTLDHKVTEFEFLYSVACSI